jgi:hypothetical protein
VTNDSRLVGFLTRHRLMYKCGFLFADSGTA